MPTNNPTRKKASTSFKGKTKTQKKRKRQIKIALMALCTFFLMGLALIMLFVGIVYYREGEFVSNFTSISDVSIIKPTRILSADDVVLGELSSERREPVNFEQIPKTLIDATISAEDHNFWTHPGIDLRGIGRALLTNLRAGKSEQGASTITQQLARNAFLSQDRTFKRKVREMAIAVHIEKKLTKKEILTLYMNRVYYGAGAYGVKAAAHVYFNKELKDLNLQECALIAGMPQSPTRYAPKYKHKNELAKKRRDSVLQSMLTEGYITQQKCEKAKNSRLHVVSRRHTSIRFKAPYFCTYILQLIEKQYGAQVLEEGGWTIRTTLLWKEQVAAEEAVREVLHSNRYANEAAVVLVDTSGRIRAMVGGSNFKRSQYNVITQGLRQPGSSFKPIVYSTAFDIGAITMDTYLEDRPMSKMAGDGKVWSPHNSNGKFHGSLSVTGAFINSVNIPAIHVLEKAGMDNVVDYATNHFGFTSHFDKVLPMALGANAVRPIEMAQAYTVFATGGNRVEPYGLERLISPDGNVNQEFTATVTPGVISEKTAETMNDLMRQVVIHGTAANAPGIHEILNAHGKTGTTSNHLDVWFCGYTGKYIGIVWAANVSYRPKADPPYEYRPMPGVFGGTVAATIWTKMMSEVQQYDKEQAIKKEEKQSKTVRIRVCDDSGMVATDNCPRTTVKTFTRGEEPKRLCTDHPPTPKLRNIPSNSGTDPFDNSPNQNPDNPSTDNKPSGEVQAPTNPDTTSNDQNKPQPPLSAPTPSPYGSGDNTPAAAAKRNSTRVQMVQVEICSDTGLIANMYCPEKTLKSFRKGEQPRRICRIHHQGSRY